MENGKRQNEIDEAASSLIANAEETTGYKSINEQKTAQTEEKADGKIFQKYKIKDIVFLAIITACTLATGAVMPLLVNVPLFGIVQLGLGLQFSIFPVIGMMKVRKLGALLLQAIFISVFLIFMFPPMALIIVCAVVAEGLALIIFRDYKNDWACVFAGTIYMPLTLPLMYGYYKLFYTVTGEAAVGMLIGGANPAMVIGISVAVVALCFLGSVVGMLISREFKKAGVLKK